MCASEPPASSGELAAADGSAAATPQTPPEAPTPAVAEDAPGPESAQEAPDPLALRDAWRVAAREYERLAEAVAPLKRRGQDPAPEDLRDVAARLRKLRLQDEQRAHTAESLAASLDATADARERAARAGLLDDLRRSAEEAGQVFRRLGDNPLEVAIGPLEVSIPESGDATVRLGREPITTVSPRATAIVSACGEQVKQLKAGLLPAPAFFDLLHRAWRMASAARGPSPDGRVDLVDLLLPLALLELGPDQWRRGRAERGVAPWPRYRMAYQLYRLRREGHLEDGGVRVELAAATLSTTRDSRNVLHVLTGEGRGQYYGAIRFVPVRSADPPPQPTDQTSAQEDRPVNDDPPVRHDDKPADSAATRSTPDASGNDGQLDQVLDLFNPPADR